MPSSLPRFLISLCLLFPFLLPNSAESPNCVAVYREGGAPAVFQSPKCPRWTLLPTSSARFRPSTPGCHVALNQGRRRSQEDRAVCELNLRIPFLRLGQDGGASCSCFVLFSLFCELFFFVCLTVLLDDIDIVASYLQLR